MTPRAVFIGWQPCSNPALSMPLFNVFNHPALPDGATVGVASLGRLGVAVPAYPKMSEVSK